MSTNTLIQSPDYRPMMRERLAVEALLDAAKDYDEYLVAAMEEFNEVAQVCLGLKPGEEDGLALANETLVDNDIAGTLTLSSEGVIENLKNAWQSLTQKEASFLEKIQGTFGGLFATAGNGLTTIDAALRDFHEGNGKRYAGTRSVHTALALNLEAGEITHGLPKAISDSMDVSSNVMSAIIAFQPIMNGHQTFKFGREAQNKILEGNRKDFLDFFAALKKAGAMHVKRTSSDMVQLANARLVGNFALNMTEPTGEITDFGKGSMLKARSVIRRYSFSMDRESSMGVDVQLSYNEVMQIAQELNNFQTYVGRSLDRIRKTKFGMVFDSVDMAALVGMAWAPTVATVAVTVAQRATPNFGPAHMASSVSMLMYQFIRSFNRLAAMRRKAVETYVETAIGLIRYNNFIFREGAKLITAATK